MDRTRAIKDADWRKWAEKKTIENERLYPELKPLQKRLLDIGGDWVALQPEDDLKRLLDRGQLFTGQVIFLRMGQSQCHSNCATIWDRNQGLGYKIATGWVLSKDGIWRQHTWLLRGKSIIETTEPREKYYGFVLSDEEANNFWLMNC